MTNRPKTKTIALTALVVLALAIPAFAQQMPFSKAGTGQPPPDAPIVTTNTTPATTNAVTEFLSGKIPSVLANGKLNVNARARLEFVDEDGVAAVRQPSYAPTIRTRIGYTTASLYGFQGMVEGENVSAIGSEENYNAAGSNGRAYKPIVADPTLTRLDQAWLGYSYENYVSAKVGEQHLVLDNQRFIGDSDWRQNWQTFDAAGIGSQPITNLDLYYGYIWDVHRVYGDVSGLAPANEDFDSKSHLINISYSGWEYGRFVGYTYLLDLSNAGGAANSCATYGGYFAGSAPVGDVVALDYRAEFAWQTDYGQSLLRYGADYYNFELGARIKPFAFGVGYEDLGSAANNGAGGGRTAFRTPLATLHQFNGWADVFLSTPNDGLRDLYGYAQVTLPAEIPLRFVYHKYDADYGGGNYGQEFDAIASKKFAKYWTATLKYAYYLGDDVAAPSFASASNVSFQKFWAQVEFNF